MASSAAPDVSAANPVLNRQPYYLLPFRFHPLSAEKEVLVNEVGDYVVCPRGTATRVVRRSLQREDPLYDELLASYFISETRIPDLIDVLATRYRTRKAFLDHFTALHIVVVTLRCNHSCHYCQVSRQTRDRLQYDISDSNLTRAIELVFHSPSPQITIEFQGGEPLAAFDKVKRAVAQALDINRRERRNLRFVLCTNLAFMTREEAEFCKLHDIHISTSLDGPRHLHDSNRPLPRGSSYDAVQEGLRVVRSVLGADMVSALMTTSRLSLEHPEEIVDAYVENGFGHIFVRPTHPYGFASRLPPSRRYTTDDFLAFYKKCLGYILDLNKRGIPLVEDYAAIILRKILTPFFVGFVDLRSPSGIINDVVVYNYDGGVYASDESRMLAETGDQSYRLGHVMDCYEDLFYGEKARHIAEHWANESLAGCSDCGLQVYCGADPVRHHATQGDPEGYRPTSDFCRKNMEIIRHLLELIDSDPVTERIFRRWAA